MPYLSQRVANPWSTLRRLARRVVLGAVLAVFLVVGGTAFRVWQVARVNDDRPADAVLVLGAAQYNGIPSAVLEARLAHAQRLYQRGVAHYVMTVGGRRVGDNYTEADSGQRWLTAHGVPSGRIVTVEEGSDTLGSLRAAAVVARQHGWSSAVIVSDPWHSLRARTMAHDAGFAAWASPTRTGPIVQTRETQIQYITRETGALLYYRLTHAPASSMLG
jgi:uncharacterized SAM-binding protein YcdF (DUF218 family)